MSRIHFIELEDQPWFPTSIRNGITDFLQFSVSFADLYKNFSGRLDRALHQAGATTVVDLCSGGGGPWNELKSHMSSVADGRTRIFLTDYFPNLSAFERLKNQSDGVIDHVTPPVSAMDVSDDIKGFRTLFSSFHHFRPRDAIAIIQDAVNKGQGIAIAESTQRHPLLLLYMLFTPLLVLASCPFQRPFRASRLFWTYLIPAIPLAVMFDGIVSCLRTYSPAELRGLVAAVDGADSYEWQIGIERMGILPVGVTYLIGHPKDVPH